MQHISLFKPFMTFQTRKNFQYYNTSWDLANCT